MTGRSIQAGGHYQEYKGVELITTQRGAGVREVARVLVDSLEERFPELFGLLTAIYWDGRKKTPGRIGWDGLKTNPYVQFRCLGPHGIGALAEGLETAYHEKTDAGIDLMCHVHAVTNATTVFVTAGVPNIVELNFDFAEYQAWCEVQWAAKQATP
jgi:hypothetical protein